jgi:hypothetical protein
MTSKKNKNPAKASAPPGDCVLPTPPRTERLNRFAVKRAAHEEQLIREYVESQAHGEKVIHLEKVATEHLRERRLDAWDVRTNNERYWVISSPINIYRQEDFQSLDFLLSFHIGLMTRVFARRNADATEEEQDRLAAAWRHWSQAAEALDAADEAQEFQAVGARCRECLLQSVRAIADKSFVPSGEPPPKMGDFIHWSEFIAQKIAGGGSSEEIRSYLRTAAKATWQLVSWLTHAANATYADAALALDATENVLKTFAAALVRYERGAPTRCPACASYRVTAVYRPDAEGTTPYVSGCEACGWTDAAVRRH